MALCIVKMRNGRAIYETSKAFSAALLAMQQDPNIFSQDILNSKVDTTKLYCSAFHKKL